MRKRLLSFVLAVLMIVCLFPVQQASAYSDAYSLPSLTGNQAADTANIAKSQLGYTYDGGTVYGAWWNGVTNWGVDYTQAGWCAIFVCWCANKAGAGLGIAYDKNGASPGYLFDWLKNNARYDTSFSTAPQAGDFIFFGNSSGGVEHVAVVTGYDASAGRVYLVGGNQGNGVGAVTSSSCRWASGSTWGSQYILGYGRPNYGGGTVTPDPDPGLSVKETITCKRTIKLPERVVNLYSNPTDTTRLIYFDYGPTVYSSRYAVMSDGSIMYEVGANHQGQVMKLWLKYESDMTVTKEHTYGSTQYESAHPHRGYRVCECGDKTYTGETTTRDDCSECGGEVKYAVEGGYLTFDKKTGTVTDCDSSVTKANIPHTIKGVTVTSIGNGAFGWCKSLTGVTIPDSVTSIGGSAFYGCTSLTSVTIPDSVTSIGGSAFGNCKSLTNMTIPDSVTLIGNGAFLGCTSLTSVTIPDSVTSIGEQAFSECTSLTSVTIPDSVTSIGEQAFSECTSLTSVTIPDSVTSIGDGAFASCTSLTGIWVAEGNNDYSSDASGVLFNKDKITLVQCPGTFREYTIPDSVTSIGEQAFMGCSSLTSVTIPDSVTSIHWGAFYDCTSLTSVTIPDSVTSIGAWAFRDCTSLTDVYYAGSEAQWKAISISSNGNDDLLTANIHYNYVSHTHSYKDVVTAPTCTEKGYTTHTCSCGDSYVDAYVDALGHAWDNGKVTKEPTATETGVRTYTCTRCSATKTETIPATGSVDVTQMFTDVTKNWAYPGIQYCVTHGIMGGMGDGTFAPTGTTTRAQIVQILYNLEGTPAVSGTTPFTDLTANWYKPAILWAYQNNVVAGTSPTTFDPDQPVTREQIAVILTQYMFHVLKMERTWTPADLSTFPDGANVSGWAKEAMQDAVALGLINGTKAPDGLVYLDSQGSAARQQVATILMNFCQNVKK